MARTRLFPFAATVFTSSFLLFQIQPIIAKMILPWFGGSAAVWTVCLLFFQVVLLAGYLYAHCLVRLSPRVQAVVHCTLLIASLLALPVVPSVGWKPSPEDEPTLRILGLLGASIGAPYFLLSTTSPLVQSWYSRGSGGALPYRLFALSNIASLAALLGYPVLIEPWIAARRQAVIWSLLYAGFAVLSGSLAIVASRLKPEVADSRARVFSGPAWRVQLLWAILAGCASAMLLSVTNYLCQNIASIPFLWVLPLGVYLLTFILCFDSDGWYRPQAWLWVTGAAIAAMSWALLRPGWGLKIVIPLFASGLFIVCMYCHGELARRKPAAEYLTSFYLMLSLGGAAGAVLVSLLAPRFFRGYYELPIGVFLCAMLVLFMVYRKWWVTDVAWAAIAIGALVSARVQIRSFESDNRVTVRNFYGSLRVVDLPTRGDSDAIRAMVHGVISHGSQFLEASRRREPTLYYGRQSGIGLALRGYRRGAHKVGVVGLGAGTMATYSQRGDAYRFYEINPHVVDLARREFTYLSDCQGTCEVVLGDARLSLEREPLQGFDLLAVDAFSGDSIPVHLLSREAFELYFRHLKPDGVLALHISNTSLELGPVVQRIAESLGKQARQVTGHGNPALGTFDSVWVLVSSDASTFDLPMLASARPLDARAGIHAWTDDYSNLFQVLK